MIRKLHLEQAPEFTGRPKPLERLIAKVRTWSSPPRDANAHASAPDASVRLTRAESLALDRFHKRLKVQRDSTSRIINVSYSSTDPVLAANVTNTAAVHFYRDDLRATRGRHRASLQLAGSAIERCARVTSRHSTRALAAFQRETGIADVDVHKNTVSEQMAELGRQETLAQSERIQLESLFTTVTSPDAVADVQKSLVIQDLSKKLAETAGRVEERSK